MFNVIMCTPLIHKEGIVYFPDDTFDASLLTEQYNEPYDNELLQKIECITRREGQVVWGRRGPFMLDHASTGAKVCLLAMHGYKMYADNAGTNAIWCLADLVDRYNLDITIGRTIPFMGFPKTDAKATCNGEPLTYRQLNLRMCELAEDPVFE